MYTPVRAATAALVAAIGLAVAPAAQATPSCAVPAAKTLAYKTVKGADKNLTSLDVYAPKSSCLPKQNVPVVLWVHGGGYSIGDKSNQTADKARLFAARKYVFVSVNYRLTTPAAGSASARFPDHYRDVAAAVAWVRKNIARYHGDGKRLALLGHSAGADIVSNVAVNPQWLKERGLKLSALRCSGPLDTEGFDKTAGGDEKAQWQNALGNNVNYLRDTSATLLVKPRIGIAPTITVVRGTPQRQKTEQRFADTLRAAGVHTTVINAVGLSHADVNKRIGAAGDTVMTPPLISFLKGCFRS